MFARICISLTVFFLFTVNAHSQTSDFFWSTKAINSGATNQPLIVDSVESGDFVSLFLYYSSDGPSDLDINVGAMLDVGVSQPGIIKFVGAEVFDFPVTIMGAVINQRWQLEDCEGIVAASAAVTDNSIETWGAFGFGAEGMVDQTANGGLFSDQGFDSDANAFLFGRIDIEVIADTGCVQLHIGPSKIGIARSGQTTNGELVHPIFGSATITVDGVHPGDVNNDGPTDLLDVAPLVQLILNDEYSTGGDTNCDGDVNLLDIDPFVALLLDLGLPVPDPTEDDCQPVQDQLGDVNVDGIVNLADLAFFNCLPVDCGNFLLADINQDGVADLSDICPMFELLLSID